MTHAIVTMDYIIGALLLLSGITRRYGFALQPLDTAGAYRPLNQFERAGNSILGIVLLGFAMRDLAGAWSLQEVCVVWIWPRS